MKRPPNDKVQKPRLSDESGPTKDRKGKANLKTSKEGGDEIRNREEGEKILNKDEMITNNKPDDRNISF